MTDKIISEVKTLHGNRIKEVFDFVEFLKMRDECDATEEILSDKRLTKSLKQGIKDIRSGHYKDWKNIR